MNRHLRGAMLITLGILLGVASSSFQQSKADPPAGDDNGRGTAAIVAELKEIKSQLMDTKSQVKDINVFLRTGVIRNFSVMNPPPDRAAPDQ